MKKDHIISILVLVFTLSMIFLVTRTFFLEFAASQKLLGGFVKFFVLASIGDFIGLRIKSGSWKIPNGILIKAIVWGIIGVMIVMMFVLYPIGVAELQSNNLLPFEDSTLAFAFFVSFIMNFTFAPVMMSAHRISDTYIELRSKGKVSVRETIDSINWNQFIRFTVFKAIPFFWIPAHTITFLIPSEYRIIFAAILGIFLGLILGLFNNDKKVSS